MPTIIVCGTPGTGKSSIIDGIKSSPIEASFFNISKFAIDNDCTSGFDEQLNSHYIDDEKLKLKLRPKLANSRLNILECIHPDHLDPEEVDQVYVVRADTTKLYDRLLSRGYSNDKIVNNVEAEIFQSIYDEAVEHFGAGLVIKLQSNEIPDLERNVSLVIEKARNLLQSK